MRLMNVIVVLALIAPAIAAQRQSPASATRTLRGVVVTSSDVPLARVRVTVGGAPPSEPSVLTDERGQFTVRVPVAELVQLTFTKARYATALVDVRRSELSGRDETVRVRLALGGAISGQVRDRFGEPVMQVTISAWRLGSAPPSVPPVQSVTTNDLGEFRFAGLVQGAYALGLRPPVQLRPDTVPQEVPAQQTVNVSLGAEVSAVDFAVDVPSELIGRSADRKPAEQGATASIRGRVTNARGTPIAGAIVQAYGGTNSAAASDAVETDARGRFVITRLPPGDYRFFASKRGFIRPDSPDRTITVLRGQTAESSDLILGRGGSITGTIADEFGEPMRDVVVSALELRAMGGRMRALRSSSAPGNVSRTDDRGRYRLYGLQPGTYVVQAVLSDLLSTSKGYVPQFYPGTMSIDVATPTRLGIDDAATGIDLTLLPAPASRVRGTVLDPAGVPARGVRLALTVKERSGAIQTEPARTSSGADGTFAFDNVPPGDYVVQATVNGRAVPAANVATSLQFAAASITVADDEPPPVQMKLSFGATLMGSVVYEGIPEVTAPYSAIRLTTVPLLDRDPLVPDDSSSFALLSDNTFEYRGVFGGNFLTVRPRNANWYVKSISYRGQDLVDSPFDFGVTETFRDIEIVVSGAAATVAGRVTDERAAPARDYSVALFSTDRSKWTIGSRWVKSVRATMDGTFRVPGVVPGDYWIVAVDRLDASEFAGDLQNPDVLDALALRAQRVPLGEGQSQNLTLRLVRR